MIERLEAFDAVSPKRLLILKALKNRELDNGEISACLGMSRKTVHWHLSILKNVRLIEIHKTRKLNLSRGAKRKTRDILRFRLTETGKKAIEFFDFSL